MSTEESRKESLEILFSAVQSHGTQSKMTMCLTSPDFLSIGPTLIKKGSTKPHIKQIPTLTAEPEEVTFLRTPFGILERKALEEGCSND